ncbi:hypothetical protein T05_510 [Trichinella murrelli]|uniref:Uncharacterized protein n=1 Tax=Trichinella murrelli TaxID=144512 RepID=A0A0V0T832_9BILA|nr:hypothetical protein T05_510 [Trichinella murrelli]
MGHINRKTVVTIQPFSISSRHNPVIALPAINDVISCSFETATLSIECFFMFIAVDLCWTNQSAYWATPPIKDANGLTCNISSLAVFAGTHSLVHIISVIHGMKMIKRRNTTTALNTTSNENCARSPATAGFILAWGLCCSAFRRKFARVVSFRSRRP